MNTPVDTLVGILEEECEMYRQMEEFLERERKIVRKMDMDALEAHLSEKVRLLGRLQALEKERSRLVAVLADEFGLAPDGHTLLELARRLPSSLARRFMQLRHQLLGLVERVSEKNESGRGVVNGLLRVMDGVVDSVRACAGSPPLYGKKGKLGPASLVSGDILRRAV